MDMAPKQILSISTSLIPFLEHDDNTRASMGTNMLRQAVPLIKPEAPLIGTGMEGIAARASGHVLIAEEAGKVTYVDAEQITVVYDSGKKAVHALKTFQRSNQATCFHTWPRVESGKRVRRACYSSSEESAEGRAGEYSLGRFKRLQRPWSGASEHHWPGCTRPGRLTEADATCRGEPDP